MLINYSNKNLVEETKVKVSGLTQMKRVINTLFTFIYNGTTRAKMLRLLLGSTLGNLVCF